MNIIARLLISLSILSLLLTSCGEEPKNVNNEEIPSISTNERIPKKDSSHYDSPLWVRHHDSSLKILAIGNSFTSNATAFMPWLINQLNGDSICIARLIQTACTLEMHWKSHIKDSPDYYFFYSDKGKWIDSDVKNIDTALELLDWDVIVIQQASHLSGIYSTFQPYLDNLVSLFCYTNPNAKLAWHYTWAYPPGTTNAAFKDYGCDSEKMYYAIIDAGDMASKNFDITIPSATLIKLMREEFKEVENGFTEDGLHISYDPALYALTMLWYEKLIGPTAGTSSLDYDALPSTVSPEDANRIKKIIRSLGTSCSIPLIYNN